MNISDIARGVFIEQLQEMQLHLDGCIEGVDPIHLHDLRVANRRTRAALSEFRDLLPDETYQKYQDDFRWIHKITGEVRDLDVGIAHYPDFKKEISKPWRPHLKPLRDLLKEKRNAAQEELSSMLQSKQIKEIFDSWSDVIGKGFNNGNPLTLESAREYGCSRIINRYRQLQNEGLKLDKATPADQFHEYRILVKKLRYLMEFYRPVMDQEEFERIRNGLRNVQDTFGTFQDDEIQTINVRNLAGELFDNDASVETMLALGQLLGVLENRLSRGKKRCLKKAQWLISEPNARAFQSCFQYPVD